MKRLFTARFRLGQFDPVGMVRYAQTPDSETDSEAHRALALKAARESMVLLKNDGVLPLSPSLKRTAVIGPSAESSRVLLGNYSGASSRVTTALDGIRKIFPTAQVIYAPGIICCVKKPSCLVRYFQPKRGSQLCLASITRTKSSRASLRWFVSTNT